MSSNPECETLGLHKDILKDWLDCSGDTARFYRGRVRHFIADHRKDVRNHCLVTTVCGRYILRPVAHYNAVSNAPICFSCREILKSSVKIKEAGSHGPRKAV